MSLKQAILTIWRAIPNQYRPARQKDISQLAESGLFDLVHYRTLVRRPELDLNAAISHYLKDGFAQGLSPNLDFDSAWYRARYADVATANLDPFVHYVRHGRIENRYPSQVVSTIADSGLFDLNFYNLQLERAWTTLPDAIIHYLREGADRGLNPNQFFDSSWYLSKYRGVAKLDNPLLDFIEVGAEQGRNPSPNFDVAWYLSRFEDVARSRMNPLRHYLHAGRHQGRSTSPFADGPDVPARFKDLCAELLPQDGALKFRGWFEVASVRSAGPEIIATSPEKAASYQQSQISAPQSVAFPPAPYIARFKNIAFLAGTRLLFPEPKTVLSDECTAFKNVEGWSIRPETMELSKGVLSVEITRAYPSSLERGLHLMHEYGGNYFHFITELLPRLIVADDAGLDATTPLLIQSGLVDNLLSLLTSVNRNEREVITLTDRRLYQAEVLDYISDVSSIQDIYVRPRKPDETILHTALVRRVADLIVSRHYRDEGGEKKPWRKLYIRRGRRYRGLANEIDVENFLVERGFELVSTEELSISAQVRIFRDAAVVIAPTGAAVTNILWCKPQARVFVFMADHEATPFELWPQLGAVSGCSVKVIKCTRTFFRDDKYAMHDNFLVDMEALKEIVG